MKFIAWNSGETLPPTLGLRISNGEDSIGFSGIKRLLVVKALSPRLDDHLKYFNAENTIHPTRDQVVALRRLEKSRKLNLSRVEAKRIEKMERDEAWDYINGWILSD